MDGVPQVFQEKLENLVEHAKSVQDWNTRLGKVRQCTCVSEIASRMCCVLERNTWDLSIFLSEQTTADSCNVHAEACPERSWRPKAPMAEEGKGRISAIPATRFRAGEHVWGCEDLGPLLCRPGMNAKAKSHTSLCPAEAEYSASAGLWALCMRGCSTIEREVGFCVHHRQVQHMS